MPRPRRHCKLVNGCLLMVGRTIGTPEPLRRNDVIALICASMDSWLANLACCVLWIGVDATATILTTTDRNLPNTHQCFVSSVASLCFANQGRSISEAIPAISYT